jgi:TfoX/Sxy family transcriptional regulator of competence genes
LEAEVAYDEKLADRVRHALSRAEAEFDERKMFGGLALMVSGHMTVGVLGDDLMVRVGPAAHEDALQQPLARPMDFTGKTMTGMVFVAGAELEGDALDRWVRRGLAFTSSLPPKGS